VLAGVALLLIGRRRANRRHAATESV
jgi:hypothetical protein